jgi:hypothetical protein
VSSGSYLPFVPPRESGSIFFIAGCVGRLIHDSFTREFEMFEQFTKWGKDVG